MSKSAAVEIAFRRFSAASSKALGTTRSLATHLALIAIWLATGPHFGWSGDWQLTANTPISIETLIVGLLLLAVSYRDSALVQAKLDELLRAVKDAHEDLVGLQNKPEEDFE